MIKKMIYIISIISIVLLTFLLLEMLPFIFESGFSGISLFILFMIILILELYLLIFDHKLLKKSWTYNMLIILVTMYVSFIYYKIYTVTELTSSLYEINIRYCRDNFTILSVMFLFILSNMFIFRKVTLKEKDL